jgi:hypothetical protein
MRSCGLAGGAIGAALLLAVQAMASPPTEETLEWHAFDEGLPRGGQWRESFDLADVDGDGQIDLVSGPPRRGSEAVPRIFLGNGAGHWRLWSEATFPPLEYDYGAARARDFDRDGRTDLALGMHLRGVVVLVQREPGRFEPWSEGIERGGSSAFSSVALEVVDWDRDGALDLLALGEGPARLSVAAAAARGLRWYRNLGAGRWLAVDLLQGQARQVFGRSLVVADLDGEGDRDVVLGSRRIGETLMLIRGSSGALPAQPLGAGGPGRITETVAVGDVDGDGRPDLLIGFRERGGAAGWTSGVDLLTGPMAAPVALLRVPGAAGILAVAVGDLHGDDALDVVAGGGEGSLWVLSRGEEGGFVRDRAPQSGPEVAGCSVSALRTADLDGDGRDEVVVAFSGEPGTDGSCPSGGSLRAWSPKGATRQRRALP